jgi:hypothetical protein
MQINSSTPDTLSTIFNKIELNESSSTALVELSGQKEKSGKSLRNSSISRTASSLLEKAIRNKNPIQVQKAFDAASSEGISPKVLWKEITKKFAKSEEEDKADLAFVQRVQSHFNALKKIKSKDIHRLNSAKMLKICIVGEMKLQEGEHKKYVKKTEVGTAYSLLVEPKKRRFTILLKGKEGSGPIKEQGGYGKVVSAVELAYKGSKPTRAMHVVQKVNLDTVKGMSDKEIEYEKKYGGMKSVFRYTKIKDNLEISKVTFIKEAFDCDLWARVYQKEPKLSNDEKITILDSLASQLEKMHADGVMHNDLKLENVLWKEGKSVFCDFGLSFEPASMQSPSPYQGMYGTPEFSAPEMLQHSKHAPSFTQEVYAFGLLAYELFHGQNFPWHEDLYNGIRGDGYTKGKMDQWKQEGLKKQLAVRERIKELKKKKVSKGLDREESVALAIWRLLDPKPKKRITLAQFREGLV